MVPDLFSIRQANLKRNCLFSQLNWHSKPGARRRKAKRGKRRILMWCWFTFVLSVHDRFEKGDLGQEEGPAETRHPFQQCFHPFSHHTRLGHGSRRREVQEIWSVHHWGLFLIRPSLSSQAYDTYIRNGLTDLQHKTTNFKEKETRVMMKLKGEIKLSTICQVQYVLQNSTDTCTGRLLVLSKQRLKTYEQIILLEPNNYVYEIVCVFVCVFF